MIELETYTLECGHCGKETTFKTSDIAGLDDDIETEVEEAKAQAIRDTEREYEGMVDPGDLPVQPQIMKELAAAIRLGHIFNAELLLDRVAEELGSEYVNAVQIGRYTPRTAAGGAR